MAPFSFKPVRVDKLLYKEGELLNRIAELLEEGFPFHEALLILLPHHSKQTERARNIAEETFRNGNGPAQVLEALGMTRSKLLPIELAEEHGRLAQAVSAVAKQLVQQQELQERTKKLLAYPIVLFCFLGLLFVLFRRVFLPNLKLLSIGRMGEEAQHLVRLSEILLKLPDMLILFVVSATSAGLYMGIWLRRKCPKQKLIIILKFPGISRFYRMLLTASFAREIGNMLLTGMSLQDSLDVLRKQDRHQPLKLVANDVREKIIEGDPLSSAVRNNVLVPDFQSFVDHGEHGGHLGKELLIYSRLMETKLEGIAIRGLGILQPILFAILAICILSAYLAILLPMYDLLNTF